MSRPAMYSPDISQHSPRLYRLGQHYGVPMTVLADRMIAFGLQRLSEIMPDKPAPEPVIALAEEPAPYRVVLRTHKAAA